MIPTIDASPADDPFHTAIPTPNTIMSSETKLCLVGRLFSMNTEPMAATTGMPALP